MKKKKPKTIRGITAIFDGDGTFVDITTANRIILLRGWTILRGKFVANVRQPKQ